MNNNIKETNHTDQDFIEVFGAREHNLRNIDIQIPKNKLVVLQELAEVENLR